MSQADTGVTSFDVPDLLSPMQECLTKMQNTLNQDRVNLVNEINRDPVPQFTQEQIENATAFLQSALDAMQDFMDHFKKESFEHIDTEKLLHMQEMARESSRQLALLLGDHNSPFNGGGMQGAMVEIKENQQAQAIRTRLTSLQDFLRTFGSVRWLGQGIADKQFEDNKKTAIAILSGLLSPTKIQAVANTANHAFQYYQSAIPGRSAPFQAEVRPFQAAIQHPQCGHSRPKSKGNPLEKPDHMLDSCQGKRNSKGEPAHAKPEKISAGAYLNCLDQQCKTLADILEQDKQKIVDMQHKLGMKMEAMKNFASVLNRIPAVLNSYVLVRLSDISATDSRMLKQWISHKEATGVHKMLETFRDDVIQERAMREIQDRLMAASGGGCSEKSSSTLKEYLFSRAMCAESDGASGAEEWAHLDAQEHSGDNDEGDQPRKKKWSHHQRARKAKFFQSIPRTPSSGTHQS